MKLRSQFQQRIVFSIISDRQLVLDAIRQVPAVASFDQILDEIALLASIQRGRDQAKRGECIPHEEVVKLFNSWIPEASKSRRR
ncbi:MAG TPA: hypothetical protein VGN23_11945 [Verrucomicrobiae bacterium]|jgi:predicted transcriptional regulator